MKPVIYLCERDLCKSVDQWVAFYVRPRLVAGDESIAILDVKNGLIRNLRCITPQFRKLAISLLVRPGITYLATVNEALNDLSVIALGVRSQGYWQDPDKSAILTRLRSELYCGHHDVQVSLLPDNLAKQLPEPGFLI